MSRIKKLFSDTAYYGISSILGRMLYYALVPLHTRILSNQQDYGVIGDLYAYVTFLNIFFLYGMETAYFRFAGKAENKERVYHQSFSLVLVTSLALMLLLYGISPWLNWLLSNNQSTTLYQLAYVQMFVLIMGIDAISTIPFARLRIENKPLKFAAIRVAGISLNVILNLFFLLLCPWLLKTNSSYLPDFYQPGREVFYIFLSNLFASAFTLILLYQEILKVKLTWVWHELRPMLIFALPLMIGGLAGMMNETLDRILLKYYLPGTLAERLAEIGIYNAAYKLSIFMTLAIQAFRMAAEPFFFSINAEKDSRKVYAMIMNYFVLACVVILVLVVAHLDLLAYILGPKYRAALNVVPILLLANLFLGVYINLSIWFKVSDQTKFGAYITITAAVVTVFLNLWLIPVYGYTGSAYATLIVYFLMAIACYLLGQKFFPVEYELTKILSYIAMAVATIILFSYVKETLQWNMVARQVLQSVVSLMVVLFAMKKFNLIKAKKTNESESHQSV